MNVRILRLASEELLEAVEYYEQEQSGLGEKLWREVDQHIEWIRLHPLIPRIRPGDYRRVNLKVFPYHIAYSAREDEVVIWAIAHSHKQPGYWRKRMS
ncbi:MAG TPA: type II toxin-antitoxin system RelE/ParE family toxin [Chthoniobacterales bacterium]|jgi:plasmid stabilization system protein ParE